VHEADPEMRAHLGEIGAREAERFVAETLWPSYLEMSSALQKYMNTVTDRIIGEAIHQDSTDAAVVAEPPSLPGPTLDN
jgi:hypothetical protein